jgi:hypothetical protein
VLVASSRPVDLVEVERWSRKERALPQFRIFLGRVEAP